MINVVTIKPNKNPTLIKSTNTKEKYNSTETSNTRAQKFTLH